MKDRILELAKECGLRFHYDEIEGLESFYHLAHQDGQRAMRERAAMEADSINSHGRFIAGAIRNLEVTNG